MSYTPVELRHVRVGRRPLGYNQAAVDQVLSDVADSFEIVWRDRGELADKVESLEVQIGELKRREQVLTNTLVAAERAAEEMRDRAKREAELIVAEAHGEARSIMRSGQGQRERLIADTHRIEALLRSALGLVVEVGEPLEAAGQAQPEEATPEPAFEPEPEVKREDPRELRPVNAAPPAPAEQAVPEPVEDEPAVADVDEQPGWPPLRRVAGRGADFDWGE